ncbi:FecR family protein [Butyricimonas synergistica]|uniref:FecR family protein n=1 Tax=Butyricimonas synergistica TaxID=544644 RepID=UPI00037EBF2C|nr:FecR domain-containing protein [Butyricimonas synergistica]
MENVDRIKHGFEQLVVRFLEKTITDDELRRLRLLMEKSEERMLQFREIRQMWLQTKLLDAEKLYDTEGTLGVLKRELRRKRQISLWKKSLAYAAGIIILLSVGGYFLYQNLWQMKEYPVIVSKVEMPDFGKVYLEVNVGETIEVTDTMPVQLAKLDVYDKAGQDSVGLRVDESKWNRLFTTKGAEYSVVLADGTKVWLNAESELRFPDVFEGKKREVYLKGEGYFEVAKNKNCEFVVHCSAGDITVLGTQFNVSDYVEERVCVTLVEGCVALQDRENREKKILAGQQALFTNTGIEVKNVDVEEYVAWREGRFVYKKRSLDYILKSLVRWYDFEYLYQDAELTKEIYTAKFERFDNVDIILKRLEQVGNIKFERKGNTVVISKK